MKCLKNVKIKLNGTKRASEIVHDLKAWINWNLEQEQQVFYKTRIKKKKVRGARNTHASAAMCVQDFILKTWMEEITSEF
jgi:hypothetical protein